MLFLTLIFLFLKSSDGLECGVPEVKPNIYGQVYTRIINGQASAEGSWPWMVSLRRYIDDGSLMHLCGGSLVDVDLVVTAAHCLATFNVSQIVVVVGVSNLKTPLNESNVFQPKQFLIHSSFSLLNSNGGNDIGLIRLSKPVRLSSKVGLICLPNANDTDSVLNKELIAIGWGRTFSSIFYATMPDVLQQTKMSVVNGDFRCGLLGAYESSKIYCARDTSARMSNVCFGDSGGPLMYFSNGKWYLYGLGSYVVQILDFCINFLPGFFTRVPSFVNSTNVISIPGNWTTGLN